MEHASPEKLSLLNSQPLKNTKSTEVPEAIVVVTNNKRKSLLRMLPTVEIVKNKPRDKRQMMRIKYYELR